MYTVLPRTYSRATERLPERGCTVNLDHMASHRAMPRTILEHYTLGNATVYLVYPHQGSLDYVPLVVGEEEG